jgi:hypothetical protein
MADHQQRIVDEWDRCSRDFWHFACNYLWITDKQSRNILLKPNKEQVRLILALESHGTVYNLKARKLGMSTIVCAYFFWKCHFFPGFQAGTLTHDEESAIKLFKKVKKYYDDLPPAFKVGKFRLKENRSVTMEWQHGAEYRVASAESEKFRSSDLAMIHFSEFAKYANPQQTLEACIGAALPDARFVYETTARGLGYAHEAWYKDQGWAKVFFPWMLDPLAHRADRPSEWEVGSEHHQRLLEYAAEHKLPVTQMWWVAHQLGKYNNSWKSFHQEHPASPELAFAMSTGRVFRVSYPDAKPFPGIAKFQKPVAGHRFALGVDPAGGGDNGDFSAWCLLDIDKMRAQPGDKSMLDPVVATFYKRVSVPEFKRSVAAIAEEYKALVIVERNNVGLPLLQMLQEENPDIDLWREQKWDKVGSKLTPRLGFYTGAMSRGSLVVSMMKWLGDQDNDPRIAVRCPRLQSEINTFVWSETRKDHAEHQPGYHDDMLFAFALASQAVEPAGMHQSAPKMATRTKPQTIREHRAFQKKWGRPWEEPIDGDPDNMDPDELELWYAEKAAANVQTPVMSLHNLMRSVSGDANLF